MFLPNWVYRILPFLYIIVGLVVATKMEHLIGIGSGAILMATGLYVWKMRIDYRHEIAAMKGRKKRVW